MSINQFLAILKARWIALACVLLITVATTLSLSLFMSKKYTATAAIVLDVKSPDPVAGMVLQGMMSPTYMATQLDVLRSERVAKKVIQMLKLDQSLQLRQQWTNETDGNGTFESWMIKAIQKPMDILPAKESSVISISYTAVQPEFAAALANAFVQAYIETTLELRVEPAKRYTAMFEAQAKTSRDRLEQARSRLSEYQQEKGIIATDERLDVETARLNELSSQLVLYQTASADSSSRQVAATSNSERLQEVLNNPVIASLKADVARQEARLKENEARLGEAHPQTVELRANINELRYRLDAETRRIASGVGMTNSINKSRENQLKLALEQQREHLLQLKAQRDQAAIYLQDVENAQRAYDAIQQRLSQASLESQTSQTNLSVLKVASPPAQPSSPNIIVNTTLAILLGSMLAVGCALAMELTDRRIRTGDDIAIGLNVPVLGELCITNTLTANGKPLAHLPAPKRALLEPPTIST